MKFKILDNDLSIREVEGKEVKLLSFPDLLLFAHQEEENWSVSEEKTGAALVHGELTKANAIKEATNRLIYQVAYTQGANDIYQLVNRNIEIGRSISKIPYESMRISIPIDTKIRVLIEALTAVRKEKEEHIKNSKLYMSTIDTKHYDMRIEGLETAIQKY